MVNTPTPFAFYGAKRGLSWQTLFLFLIACTLENCIWFDDLTKP